MKTAARYSKSHNPGSVQLFDLREPALWKSLWEKGLVVT